MPSTIVSRSVVFRSDPVAAERAAYYKAPQVTGDPPSRPTIVKRLAHVGGDTWDFSRPRRYCIRELEGPIPCLESNNLADYETGCREHKGCYGHVCTTPIGVKLVPGILAKRTTENRNLFNEAARIVFERVCRDTLTRYQDFLRSVMLGKRGHIRGSMVSCHIEGSARLVIVSSWDIGYQEVSIPVSLARNFRVASTTKRNGAPLLQYEETNIVEGDWVILVRPPSLGHSNAQPFRVKLWDKPCIGLYPGHCAEFHGDFDGDEMQFYHVSNRDSILECEQWAPISEDPFEKPARRYLELRAVASGREDSARTPVSKGKFMEASNMSVQEIQEGHPTPALSAESRMKTDMIMEFAQRLRSGVGSTADVGFRYVAASIAGQSDIRRQQLSQGHIGDISRQARLAATCFSVDEVGRVLVCTEHLQTCIGLDTSLVGTRGNVFLRGVNVLCSKAQQALLDSHRAGVAEARGRNLVEDIMQGSDITLVSVKSGMAHLVTQNPHVTWSVGVLDEHVALVSAEGLTDTLVRQCLSLSSPRALDVYTKLRLKDGVSPTDVVQECITRSERAVHIVCVQVGVKVSRQEARSLAWMMSYDPGAHHLPVTHKHGGAARGLRPFVTMLNVHFGIFPALCAQGKFDSYADIATMSENLAFGGAFQ